MWMNWDKPLPASRGFSVAQMVKNLPANAEDVRDTGLIPGSGRFPGRGHGNPLWYSCLENTHATVHMVAQSQT